MMNNIATFQHSKALEILKKPYVRRLQPDEEGRGFTATISEFPGCIAEGDTADQALQNLEKTAASWLEVSIAHGREVRDPVSFDGCSGKIALRIPRGLHRQVAELAEEEGCSVNQLLTSAIASYVSGKQIAHLVSRSLEALPRMIRDVHVATASLNWAWEPSGRLKNVSTFATLDPIALRGMTRPVRFLTTDKPQVILESVHG